MCSNFDKTSQSRKSMPTRRSPPRTSRQEARLQARPRRARRSGRSACPTIPEDQLTTEQRALMSAIASGPRGHVQDERPVLLLPALPGIRRTRPEAWRPPALRHFDPATADRIRHPYHRAHVEGAVRMGGARAAGAEGRRQASDHRGLAGRARAEIGAQGRARAVCLHPGGLPHRPRQRPCLQGSAGHPRRRRHGRAGGPARLLLAWWR